jgi:hypothetical protein
MVPSCLPGWMSLKSQARFRLGLARTCQSRRLFECMAIRNTQQILSSQPPSPRQKFSFGSKDLFLPGRVDHLRRALRSARLENHSAIDCNGRLIRLAPNLEALSNVAICTPQTHPEQEERACSKNTAERSSRVHSRNFQLRMKERSLATLSTYSDG